MGWATNDLNFEPDKKIDCEQLLTIIILLLRGSIWTWTRIYKCNSTIAENEFWYFNPEQEYYELNQTKKLNTFESTI